MIHVVLASDNHFVQHLGVTLCSLLRNRRNDVPLKIHIIEDHLTNLNKERLQKLLTRTSDEIMYYKINLQIFEGFYISKHINLMTYCRIMIPKILPQSISKVIYLDADLIVKDDLGLLWETDISNVHLAAVKDADQSQLAVLNISPENHSYFNAGVLVINLEKWRQENIAEQLITYINAHNERIKFWDQDALNVILQDQWKPLHPKWNLQTRMFNQTATSSFDFNELSLALTQPSIIHFSSHSKPWHYLNEHPFRHEYFEYLKWTDWKDSQFQDKNMNTMTRKFLKKALPKGVVEVIKNTEKKFFRQKNKSSSIK